MVLPYTDFVFYSFLAQYNQDIWPAQTAALFLALIASAAPLRPREQNGRLIGLILAAGFAWTGIVFYWLEFSRINFLAQIYAVFFVLEALLLFVSLAVLNKRRFRFQPNVYGWAGSGLIMLALAGFPALDAVVGQGWRGMRLPGVTPGPTVLMTLGLLLQAEDRAPHHLAAIPVIWCLVNTAVAWSLNMPADMALSLTGLAAAVLILLKNRR